MTKMSFGEWAYKTKLGITDLNGLTEWYNEYQKYLQKPEKKSLKWEDIMKECKEGWLIDVDVEEEIICLKNVGKLTYAALMPTEKFAKREIARMQWAMIAHEANEGKEIDWEDRKMKYFLVYDHDDERIWIDWYESDDKGGIHFYSKEKLQQAWDENPEIVNQMFDLEK